MRSGSELTETDSARFITRDIFAARYFFTVKRRTVKRRRVWNTAVNSHATFAKLAKSLAIYLRTRDAKQCRRMFSILRA